MKKYSKLLMVIWILSSFCVSCNIEVNSSVVTPIVLENFTNITFTSNSFVYDGESHSIYVNNAPSFATVKYSNNNQTNVGTYTVSATISAEGYKDLTLTAELTITAAPKKNFENITMNDKTVAYNGEYQTIVPSNVPTFATITYSSNYKQFKECSKTPYKIKCSISAYGYVTLNLEAYLTITGQEFSGITLEDQYVTYNGYNQTFTNLPINVPTNANVYKTSQSYTYKEINTNGYDITYVIKQAGYYDYYVSAKFYIVKKTFEGITFSDVYKFYSNAEYEIKIDTKNTLPSYTSVTYQVLNGSSYSTPSETLKLKDVGEYTVKATISNDNYYYAKLELTAHVSIINPSSCITTDASSSNKFIFDDTVTYQQLKNELDKGNYSIRVTYRDEFDNVLDEYKSKVYDHDSYYNDVYVCDNRMLTKVLYISDESINNVRYSYTKDDNVVFYQQYPGYFYKTTYSEEEFAEVMAKEYRSLDFTNFFTESISGGFTPASHKSGSITYYTDPSFSIEDSSFSFSYRAMYFHPEWTHYETLYVTIYDIGNTSFTIPTVLQH